MALTMYMPNAPGDGTVPLPAPPKLARSVATSAPNEVGRPGVKPGEVVNIVNETLDGQYVYGVVRDEAVERRVDGTTTECFRQGWLQASDVDVLDFREATEAVEAGSRLTLLEMLDHSTLAIAEQDWDSGGGFLLFPNDFVFISSVRDGWAEGWTIMSLNNDRGWFPLAVVRKVDTTGATIDRDEDRTGEPLQEELRRRAPANLQQPYWQASEVPCIEEFDEEEAAMLERDRQRMEAETAAFGAASAGEERQKLMLDDILPEEHLPLYVCKEPFKPPGGTETHMLELEAGDLVRVDNRETNVYHGILDKSGDRGWFPPRHVELVWDRLAPAPTWQIGMPEVPERFKRRHRLGR